MSGEKAEKVKTVALVGATGNLGNFLLLNLIKMGYLVRILVRGDDRFSLPGVEVFRGDLSNSEILERLVDGVDCVINSSGEVRDIEKMWATNVLGVRNLVRAINKSGVKYFFQISSAGVVGVYEGGWIDETIQCRPQNPYEKSKFEAEKIIMSELIGAKYFILRPTNIVFPFFNPQVDFILSTNLWDQIKRYLKSEESCHLIHVHDVVGAIVHFIRHPDNTDSVPIYFLSIDHDENNFFHKIYARCFNKPIKVPILSKFFLLIINYIRYRDSLAGRRFSSEKILKTGFKYKYSVELILKEFNSNK